MSGAKLQTPSTPLHPEPDSEMNLDGIDVAEAGDLNLDLNSDMSEDDDDGVEFEDVEMKVPPTQVEAEAEAELPNPVLENLKSEDEKYGGLMSSESVTSLKALNDLKEFATVEEYDDGGFADVEQPRYSPINPFADSKAPTRGLRDSTVNRNYMSEERKLSSAQQSRFVQYIDNKLMQIQRNFIKYLSAEKTENNVVLSGSFSPDESEDTKYTLIKLLTDLSAVLDFIWYSIFETKTIPLVTNKYDNDRVNEPPIVHPSRLFGQTNYLIKIMGDLTDYISKYDFEEWHDLTDLLQFLKKVDSFVSILIDQSEESQHSLIDNTEKVRIDSIITRTKAITMQKFEHMKFKLQPSPEAQALGSKRKPVSSEHESLETILARYEEKIGEIYEGIIDRTSI